mmetsp:Transcript_5036/g.12089  ORF Transcript_5036/g.12089 Transcript_5036/m.12089 type:complete len:87 (-) Transcript_5036:1479-1739(-)
MQTQLDPSSEFRVTVSFYELYLETIKDLLEPSHTNLNIREDPKTGVFLEGLTQVVVTSPKQLLDLIQEGAAGRATSTTRMVCPPPV